HGDKDRDPRRDRLLHDLVTRAPTHGEDGRRQRQLAVEEGPAGDLVDRVVAADVLAQGHELATGREETGRVQTAGRVEYALPAAQLLREGRQHRGLDARAVRQRRVIVRERLHRRRAADTAGGAREE